MTSSIVLGLGLALGLAHQAPPAEPPQILVAPTEVDGALGEADQQRLTAALPEGLAKGGLVVVPAEPLGEACGEPRQCLRDQAASVGARYLVVSSLRVEHRVYRSQIDVIDPGSGEVVASSNEPCEVCGIAEVTEMIAGQAGALTQRLDALALSPSVLVVEGSPAGATITVDGRAVATAPYELELSAGEHLIEVSKDGYLPSSRTVEGVPGVREPWRFELEPEPKPEPAAASTSPVVDEPSSARKDPLMPVGLSLLGLGTPSLAAGVTFIVLEERPFRPGCVEDDAGLCQKRWRSQEAGIALAAVGGAMMVTGLVLTAVGAKRRAAARRVGIWPVGLGRVAVGGRF